MGLLGWPPGKTEDIFSFLLCCTYCLISKTPIFSGTSNMKHSTILGPLLPTPDGYLLSFRNKIEEVEEFTKYSAASLKLVHLKHDAILNAILSTLS